MGIEELGEGEGSSCHFFGFGKEVEEDTVSWKGEFGLGLDSSFLAVSGWVERGLESYKRYRFIGESLADSLMMSKRM